MNQPNETGHPYFMMLAVRRIGEAKAAVALASDGFDFMSPEGEYCVLVICSFCQSLRNLTVF